MGTKQRTQKDIERLVNRYATKYRYACEQLGMALYRVYEVWEALDEEERAMFEIELDTMPELKGRLLELALKLSEPSRIIPPQ